MAVPNQIPKMTFTDFASAEFQRHYSQLCDAVNHTLGHSGVIEVADHISLGGNRIINLGAPQEETDALQSGTAQQSYSASVLAKQLEPAAASPLKGYRQINNKNQREQMSSFLNDLMSTPPSANSIFPTMTNSLGTVTVSIPSGRFQFADGSFVNLIGRTDILSPPAQFAISSISCTGNVVTVGCAATGLVAGQIATISGVTPSVFNGTFPLTSSTGGGAVLTYQEDLGTASGSGGNVQVNGCYYYAVQKRSQYIFLLGPFFGDTAQNRLEANNDGFQVVAVVVITNSGGQISQSGGGASPIIGSPTAGVFF
jgi:hypothetical protein